MWCFIHFWLLNVLGITMVRAFSISQLPKMVWEWCLLHVLIWKLSKCGPALVCFVPFDSDMCFAPQRRATFHLSSGRMAPRPPLERAYFLTLRSHESWDKRHVSRPCHLLAHLRLLSSAFLFWLSCPPLPIPVFHVSRLLEVWLLNFFCLLVNIGLERL